MRNEIKSSEILSLLCTLVDDEIASVHISTVSSLVEHWRVVLVTSVSARKGAPTADFVLDISKRVIGDWSCVCGEQVVCNEDWQIAVRGAWVREIAQR